MVLARVRRKSDVHTGKLRPFALVRFPRCVECSRRPDLLSSPLARATRSLDGRLLTGYAGLDQDAAYLPREMIRPRSVDQ